MSKIFHERLPSQVGLLISFVESKLLLINIVGSIAFHERNVWPIGATTPIRRRVPLVARSHDRPVYPPSLGSRGMICSEASIIEDHTERKENPRMAVGECSGTPIRDSSTCIVRFDDRPSYKYCTAQPIGISRRTAIVLIYYLRTSV